MSGKTAGVFLFGVVVFAIILFNEIDGARIARAYCDPREYRIVCFNDKYRVLTPDDYVIKTVANYNEAVAIVMATVEEHLERDPDNWKECK